MVTIDKQQLEKVADFMKSLPDTGNGLNFYSYGSGDKEFVATDEYPSLDHPQAVNFFFFVCLHQFGFWYGDH